MIKVINSTTLKSNNSLCVGTHNGMFHCDEVIAIAILNILFDGRKDVEVIRSRNLELLNNITNIMVDIGGGKFDHHQKEGNGKRKNGVLYASAGLIWKEFGKQVIELLAEGHMNNDDIKKIFNMIDNDIIQCIDKEDNGQSQVVHSFQFVKEFLPSWYSVEDCDKNFEDCVNVSSEILKKLIKGYISRELAKKALLYRLNLMEYRFEDVLYINSQNMPWLETVTEYNKYAKDDGINFVVFKYPDGGYALQCVPNSMEDSFSKRVPLPSEWAGETVNLASISGVKTATFCHRGRFFARAENLNDVIKMCFIATKEYKKQKETPVRKKVNPE